jgi:hypothetical protein
MIRTTRILSFRFPSGRNGFISPAFLDLRSAVEETAGQEDLHSRGFILRKSRMVQGQTVLRSGAVQMLGALIAGVACADRRIADLTGVWIGQISQGHDLTATTANSWMHQRLSFQLARG